MHQHRNNKLYHLSDRPFIKKSSFFSFSSFYCTHHNHQTIKAYREERVGRGWRDATTAASSSALGGGGGQYYATVADDAQSFNGMAMLTAGSTWCHSIMDTLRRSSLMRSIDDSHVVRPAPPRPDSPCAAARTRANWSQTWAAHHSQRAPRSAWPRLAGCWRTSRWPPLPSQWGRDGQCGQSPEPSGRSYRLRGGTGGRHAVWKQTDGPKGCRPHCVRGPSDRRSVGAGRIASDVWGCRSRCCYYWCCLVVAAVVHFQTSHWPFCYWCEHLPLSSSPFPPPPPPLHCYTHRLLFHFDSSWSGCWCLDEGGGPRASSSLFLLLLLCLCFGLLSLELKVLNNTRHHAQIEDKKGVRRRLEISCLNNCLWNQHPVAAPILSLLPSRKNIILINNTSK